MRSLDLDLLRTFQTVARLGRFKDAARHLHKSPATVTGHIQRLEDLLGGRLFCRHSGGIELTPFGEVMLFKASRLLEIHDDMARFLDIEARKCRIRIGVPGDYAGFMVRDVVVPFSESNPGVELSIRTLPSADIRDLFMQARLDLAIVVVPADGAVPGRTLHLSRPVWAGGIGFGVNADGVLPISLQGLGCPFRDAALASMKSCGYEYKLVLESASGSVIDAAVESGLALAVLDERRISTRMRVVTSEYELPEIPVHQAVLLSNSGDPVVGSLADFIVEKARI